MNQRIIYTTPEGGIAVVVPSGELPIEQVLAKDVPSGTQAEIVDLSVIPSDRTFRGAWVKSGQSIIHDMSKAKEIAHNKRRAARAIEFEPHDEIIAKQIPGKSAQEAEAARQAIRDKYAAMQNQMDAAQTIDELKELLP